MKTLLKSVGILLLLAILFYAGTLMADKEKLASSVIRLHVIANSDEPEDQEIKLIVRDAVLKSIESDVAKLENKDQVKAFLSEHIDSIQDTVNTVLCNLGSCDRARVYLSEESFDVREYDTFTLPSGIYDALRIEIGHAEGENWWCVIFPSLCLPTSREEFFDTAVSAGFSTDLADTLCGTEQYNIRFFFLDCLGQLENFFDFLS